MAAGPRPESAPAQPGGGDGAAPKKKGKAKEPPAPPPPSDIVLQIHCISWKYMDYRMVAPVSLELGALKELLEERHGTSFSHVDLFRDYPQKGNRISTEDLKRTIGDAAFSTSKRIPHPFDPASLTPLAVWDLWYDYFPHADPYPGRPFAGWLRADNPLVQCDWKPGAPN